MDRTKVWIALAGVVATLLGGVAAVVATSGSGTKHVPQVATSASTDSTAVPGPPTAAAPATTVAPRASTPATTAPTVNQANAKAPSTTVAVPVPEVQKILDAIASQSQQAAANTPGKPVTKEEVEAQLRAQLKQLGINY